MGYYVLPQSLDGSMKIDIKCSNIWVCVFIFQRTDDIMYCLSLERSMTFFFDRLINIIFIIWTAPNKRARYSMHSVFKGTKIESSMNNIHT